MLNIKLAAWSLRLGLAFVFTYASVEMYIEPQNFLKYLPSFILNFIPVEPFLYSFGIVEFLLAICLLTGWKSIYTSLISIALMGGIIFFNTEYFDVLFRNVAIAFSGVALLIIENKKWPFLNRNKKKPSQLVK